MSLEGSVPIVSVEQEDSSLVTFTTGSSGTPKGANRTHRFLAASTMGSTSAFLISKRISTYRSFRFSR